MALYSFLFVFGFLFVGCFFWQMEIGKVATFPELKRIDNKSNFSSSFSAVVVLVVAVDMTGIGQLQQEEL